MKKLIAISAILATVASASVFAQGTVVFNNDGNTRVTLSESAAAALGVAVGSPVPKGSATLGDPFRVSLYYAAGPAGTQPAESALALGSTANFSRFSAGTWVGGNLTLTGVPENASMWVQVRAWEAAYGSTYGDAFAAAEQNGRKAIVGQSTMWNMTAGNSLSAPSIVQGGFTGFQVSVVPEPSTIALGLLGLAGLFIFRRRQ